MENQLIEIEDLQVGDEIIIACQACIKYLRVLDKPRIGKRLHWSTKQPLYSAVRCSTKQEVVTSTSIWNGKTYTRTEKHWRVTPDDHNVKISQDLNNRQMWLVKREQNLI